MVCRVILPRQFRAPELFPQVQREFGRLERVPSHVQFDFSQLKFARPSGVVFLSNLTRYLRRNGCKVTYCGLNPSRDPVAYMDDSLFFEQHCGRRLLDSSQPRPTTMPLMEIRHTEVHGWIGFQLIPWLAASSGVPEQELAEFRTCMSELFNNIQDHTEYDVGSVFAQWFPQEHKLEIVVADFGSGIPRTVRTVEAIDSDANAILRSFDEGFSAKSIPTNRGAGLHYLRQNVLNNLGGKLRVHSGGGVVRFEKNGNSHQVELCEGSGYCPGTMVELEIRTDRIEFDEVNDGSFEW